MLTLEGLVTVLGFSNTLSLIHVLIQIINHGCLCGVSGNVYAIWNDGQFTNDRHSMLTLMP